jgi:glutaredoxin
MGLLLLVALLAGSVVAGMGCSSCGQEPDDGTQPASQDLPAFELRDDTADLLITWVDEKGDHHVVQRPAEVPEGSRDMVRVVTLQHGHGDVLYVADLRTKNADGTYPVKTMARSGWELVAQQRRAKSMAALSPTASASAGAPPTAPAAPASARLSAIVYAASWCSACRSAEAYLRSQGVTVIVKDIEKDPGAQAEMDQKLHKAGFPKRGTIPVIDIRGRILVGFDQRDIKRAIQESTRGDLL